MDEPQTLGPHAIIARREEFASPLTLEALQALVPANEACDLDPVTICVRSDLSDPNKDPLARKDPSCWALKGARLLPHRLAELRSEQRPQAALAMALILEDGIVTRNIATTRLTMCLDKQIDEIQVQTFLVPGAMVAVHWIKELALQGRRDATAADHLAAHLEVRIDPTLTAHELVEVLPGVEALLSDLASYGTYHRHLMDSMKHKTPPRHKIQLRLP